MSWTKFTCFFAFCALLAAPVMADPSISVGLDGGAIPVLDASGGFVWNVSLDPDEAQFEDPGSGDNAGTSGASLALDLGLDLAGGLDAASASKNAGVFDTDIPGNNTFGDETADGDGDFIGVQVGSDASNVFAAVGSSFVSDGAVAEAVAVVTAPLNTDNLTTSFAWSGDIGQGGSFDDQLAVSGSDSFTAIVGDVNLDGIVNITDLGILSGAWLSDGGFWQNGNLNNQTDTTVNITDLGILSGNWLGTSGAGSVVGNVSVPEPSTVCIVALGVAGISFLRRRA